MRRERRYMDLVLWTSVGLAAVVVIAAAFPRAFPFHPADWRIHRGEAIEIARRLLSDLGETVEDPYVVCGLGADPHLEHRLLQAAGPGREEALRDSFLGRQTLRWDVWVFAGGAPARQWASWIDLSAAGEVVSFGFRMPEELPGDGIEPAAARRRAAELLHRLGVGTERFDEPELRRIEQAGRTDLALRYRDHQALLGADTPHGVEVTFAGDRLASFKTWIDDPQRQYFPGPWPQGLLWQLHVLAPYLLFPWVAILFLRRYHEGQAGFRRGLGIFLLLAACGVLFVALGAAWNGRWSVGTTARQAAWLWGIELTLLWAAPVALVAALAWAAGEARCRDRWGGKLAAFDAVLRGRLGNATVARAALKGPAAGLAVTAVLLAALVALPTLGVQPLAVWLLDGLSGASPWPGLSLLVFSFHGVLLTVLAQLFLLSVAVPRLGRLAGGAATAAVSGVFLFPPLATFPPGSEAFVGVATAAVVVALMLAFDLLTALLAAWTVHLTVACLPWLFAQDAFLQLQGALPLAVLAVPWLLSLRGLASGEEAVYHWRDVPPHARRIAERERQRMELLTAQAVQSSILPQLPRQIDGVELAHVFRPAGEIGGDFYDVTALPDGRLAVAVGDVAGHGVASGLVMSMARSALAVQVGSDAALEAVFGALNRTLYRTARKSRLATLCYGLLDPRRRELVFASAGHLCPYLIHAGGRVQPLESIAYPLGVRAELEIHPRRVPLAAGDLLFLCSDGVVEAHPEGDPEPFGFERLEESLARHANGSPEALCASLLADLERFAGAGSQADDLTLLVLRLPAAPGAETGDRP